MVTSDAKGVQVGVIGVVGSLCWLWSSEFSVTGPGSTWPSTTGPRVQRHFCVFFLRERDAKDEVDLDCAVAVIGELH